VCSNARRTNGEHSAYYGSGPTADVSLVHTFGKTSVSTRSSAPALDKNVSVTVVT
jgi:hypothetical protein